MQRRTFIQTTGLAAVALSTSVARAFPEPAAVAKNPLPKWKGFNLLDFFSPDPSASRRTTTDEQLAWMHDWGFDFVRIPIAYPYYLNFDRNRNITPEEVYNIDPQAVERIDQLVHLAHKHNLHVSLNLHRAPGYCINAGFHEPYNLWTDQPALDAFCFHWNMWAKRYKDVSPTKISFDLLNEPSLREDMNDQHARQSTVPGTVIPQNWPKQQSSPFVRKIPIT